MITELIGAVRYLLRVVLIDPVREGRLRNNGWPAGLRGIVTVGFSLAMLLILVAGLSSLIRSHVQLIFLPPQQSIPWIAVPVVIAALFFATGTLYAALLHVRPVVRIPGLSITLLIIVRISTTDGGIDMLPALTGCGLLIIFAVLRRRSAFAWWEFVVAQLLTVATLSAALVRLRLDYAEYAPRLVLNTMNVLGSTMWLLAAPFAVLSGAAITELTISLAMAVGEAIVRRRPAPAPTTESVLDLPDDQTPTARSRLFAVGAIGVLVLGRIAQVVHLAATDPSGFTAPSLIGGFLTAVIPLAGLYLVHRIRASPAREPLDGQATLEDWRRWAVAAATLIAGTAIWLDLVMIPIRVLHADPAADAVLAIPSSVVTDIGNAVAVLALVMIAMLSRRRHGRLPMILILLAGFRLIRLFFQLIELPVAYSGITITADLAALVLAGYWWSRRALTATRLTGIAAVIMITILFEYRDAVTEPITQLLALSGALAGLLVGAIWRLLTDNGFAAGDSVSFPRPARVLLVVANGTFGTAAIALVALQGGISDFDLQAFENLGDKQLGGDLMFSLLIAIIVHTAVAGGIWQRSRSHSSV